ERATARVREQHVGPVPRERVGCLYRAHLRHDGAHAARLSVLDEAAGAATWPGPWTERIWLGASVENRKALPRLDALRASAALVRFLSLEALLEDLGPLDLAGIQWVIVGGESGPDFRPMDHAWARAIRDQCVAAGVPFFLTYIPRARGGP